MPYYQHHYYYYCLSFFGPSRLEPFTTAVMTVEDIFDKKQINNIVVLIACFGDEKRYVNSTNHT